MTLRSITRMRRRWNDRRMWLDGSWLDRFWGFDAELRSLLVNMNNVRNVS
jgi:hypothetical protein